MTARSSSKRMTRQRKKILEVVKNTTSHPTADWIYEQVKKEIPSISLGTVYRNLNVLAEMGEILILEYSNNQSRFDGNPETHYHLKCEECSNVYDINLEVKENLNKKANKQTPFQVSGHRLEFYGHCPDCQ